MGTTVTSEQSKQAKLDLKVLQSQLSAKQKHMIDENTVYELNKLAQNPDYGEEFLDVYRDHLNILSSNSKYTSRGYLCAVKFFSLVESGNSLTESYILVFPERLKARTDRGQTKSAITGEASRYNATALVSEIRKVATTPVQLIFRHLLYESITNQAELMRNAKSEIVRQKAGETLIKELKPSDDNVISIQVEDGAKSAIASLREATEKLIIKEQQSIQAGVPIKTIIESKIVSKEIETDDIEEAEFTEEIRDKPIPSKSNTFVEVPDPEEDVWDIPNTGKSSTPDKPWKF